MPFHLYIMRHAKSDWSASNRSDFDRPINARGEKNAKRIGQWLVDNNKIPQHIISSPAIRAKQTTELVLAVLTEVVPEQISYQHDLYLASLETLLASIQSHKTGLNSLMLVAHNPGLEQLVHYLSTKSDNSDSNCKPMKTANLALFSYPDSEFDVYNDKGKLVEFIKPKFL